MELVLGSTLYNVFECTALISNDVKTLLCFAGVSRACLDLVCKKVSVVSHGNIWEYLKLEPDFAISTCLLILRQINHRCKCSKCDWIHLNYLCPTHWCIACDDYHTELDKCTCHNVPLHCADYIRCLACQKFTSISLLRKFIVNNRTYSSHCDICPNKCYNCHIVNDMFIYVINAGGNEWIVCEKCTQS